VAGALRVFAEDADLMGTSLYTYSQHVVAEVITVGRAGTLVDWESEGEQRAYVVRYSAEQVLNWRVERCSGLFDHIYESHRSRMLACMRRQFEFTKEELLSKIPRSPNLSGELTPPAASHPPRPPCHFSATFKTYNPNLSPAALIPASI